MDKYAKAFVGAAIAGLGAVGTAMGDEVVSPKEWVTVAIVALVTLAGVWAIPNAKATPDEQ